MKKSLIALAVLAASGAAMAQSSVTLYGIADVWVGSVETDTGVAATSSTKTQMISGGVSTSRWGMKGTEDLGGGLKANFNLESAVNVDDGASSGFTRQAWVGVSGGFGAVKLGLASSPFDNVQAMSNGAFDSDLAPANNPAGGVMRTANNYKGKVANSITYETPNFSGFGAQIQYGLDEETAATLTAPATKAITSLAVTYAAGPLAAQFAYQQEESQIANVDDVKFMRLGASYNFGMATAKFTYGQAENVSGGMSAYDAATSAGVSNNAASTTEYQLGVDVPVSSALTLGASYASSTDDSTLTSAEVTRSGFGLAAAYSLSKRTTVYGGLKMVTDEQVGRANDIEYTVYAVGIKHAF